MDSYLKMMKQMTVLYRQYETEMTDIAADTADFASFIEDLNESRFHQMMTGIPKLFNSASDPLFRYKFELKDLKRLTEVDSR